MMAEATAPSDRHTEGASEAYKRQKIMGAPNPQRGAAGKGVVRAFPMALAQMENGVEGQMQRCVWQVVCNTTEPGAGRLTVTGGVQCKKMVASIRSALAWARLHCKAVTRLFPQQEVDLARRDLDYYVDLAKDDLQKSGSSVGLATACAFVCVISGMGVETCVAMTGEVALSGAVGGVGGLEGKLRIASSSSDIKVVVLPRDNLAEAERLVHEYSLSSIRLLPVSHMDEVIRLLFLSSVEDGANGEDTGAAVATPTVTAADASPGFAEAPSWVLLDENGDFALPTVECAFLPGSGQSWCNGVDLYGQRGKEEGPPEVEDQVLRSLCCVQQMLGAPGMGLPPAKLVVHEIFGPQWDIYVHVRGDAGKTSDIGLAAVCALLALALGRQIDAQVFHSGSVSLRGRVLPFGSVTPENVMSLVRSRCTRVLVNPTAAARVAGAKAELVAQQALEAEDRRLVEALEVVEVNNVVTMGRALCDLL